MSEMHGTASSTVGAPPHGPGKSPGRGRTAGLPLTPVRRVALVLGVPACLALTAFAGLNIAAQIGKGSFRFSHTFPAGTGRLTVSVSSGDIALLQVAGGQAKLAGSARYSLVRPGLTERTSRDSATLGYYCSLPVGDCGMNATVSVPAGTAVTVTTGGGNATATGTTGDVTLSTGGGDVTADHVTGALDLHTNGGNIRASAVTGIRLSADTGGGDIEITFARVPRDVRVATDGGNVTIVVPRGTAQYHVSASTNGGDVTDTVPLNTSSPNGITATSGGGNITIRQAS